EPRIGKLPRRERVARRRSLDVGFDTGDELAELPVVASLDAAGDAGRVGWIVAHIAPFVADIGAEIGAHPVEAGKRRGGAVVICGGKVGSARRAGYGRGCDEESCAKPCSGKCCFHKYCSHW